MKLYPLLSAPHFVSGEKTPWGGNMLRGAFLKDAPEQTGESFEISALPECESVIRNGIHAGKTLSRFAELCGASLTGAEGAFPLLVKLIDVSEALPEETTETARVWVVLNCDGGCKLVLNGEEKNLCPGDVYYIPSDVRVALVGGAQLYQACACASESAAASSEKIFGTTLLCKGGSRTYYAANEHFEFCRLNLSGRMPLHDGRMHLITPLAPCTLRWSDESIDLLPFESAIIPAALDGIFVESEDCKLFCASPSDRDSLKAELGYRAENVAGLC